MNLPVDGSLNCHQPSPRLVAIGALSLGLLILGTKFMTGALAVTLFLVVFWFVFGIMDGLTWDEALPSSFSMCVLPLVLSLLSGILAFLLQWKTIVRAFTGFSKGGGDGFDVAELRRGR